MYLFKTLPLPVWKLTMDDLSFLEHLILNHPITSAENSLSRYILSKLFSGCNENDIEYVLLLSFQLLVYDSFIDHFDVFKKNIIFCNAVILC